MSEIWNKYTTDWVYHKEQVMKFNTLCGNELKDNDLIIPLYYGLCKEEAEEAYAAINLKDVNGNIISEEQALNDLVDAACDMFYVGYYLLTKVNTRKTARISDINEMAVRLEYLSVNSSSETYTTSVDLLGLLKVDPTEALNKVHESNLSKFIDVTGIPLEDITEIAETEVEEIKQEYKAKGKDLKEVTYQVNPYGDESWLTFYNENGKVLKPSTFFEPDFTDVIKHLL